ncbi:MAG: DUF192 domain-containing protein [Nitrosomonas sp.]|nr:DUF192 domain-containing protein [Nitrosomonas sp.]MBK7364421.1 DUF192 domain-containing protein [Nitrosomonas sp.]
MVSLSIGEHRLHAEIAHTYDTRAKGLMNRATLPENQGMLFIFPKIDFYSMWMFNTPLPLSVAFISEKGIILNIEVMKPFSTVTHSSIKPAKYALEMNHDWFVSRKITAGNKIIGLENVPDAIE